MVKFEYVKNADKSIPLPKRGTSGSAGYDFYAPKDIVVPAKGCSELVFFGVKAYMPKDVYLGVVIRSSLAVKHAHLQVAQGISIIDADYVDNETNEGDIGIMFYNNGDKDYTIKKGERCCQGIFSKYIVTRDDDCVTERVGGYGSTEK